MTLDWARFVPGYSVFVPAIDTARVVAILGHAAAAREATVLTRVCVVDGLWGVRAWRVS
jgi:hypothetical protein